MRLRLGSLADWCGGKPIFNDPEMFANGISSDSRSLPEGALFAAIRGPNFDGHDFVSEAKRRGAVAVIVEDELRLGGMPGIVVEDTVKALGAIAHGRRWQKPLIPWIGVTGSNGKTTCRELIARMLLTKGPVACSSRNYNNEIGLPLSLLNAPDEAWAGVLEVGVSASGEIERLVDIMTPTVGVVTCTGPSHLAGFGTIEAIAHEKAKIFSKLPFDGVAIYPAHDSCAGILRSYIPGNCATFAVEKSADMVAENVRATEDGMCFIVRGVEFLLPLLGRHNVHNCLAGLLAAEHLGIGLQEAAAAIQDMEPISGRLQTITSDFVTVIDDTYNANPASFASAVEVIMNIPASRRIVIAGDMLELGENSRNLHRDLGRLMARYGVDLILAVGRESIALAEFASASNAKARVSHFRSVNSLIKSLKGNLQPGDLVLVKGSRGMHLETVVEAILEWSPEED